MKTNDFTEKWEAFQRDKGYLQRLDPTHPMDFFIGIDENGHDELVLITCDEPMRLKSSKELEVNKNIRRDGRWATQIASINVDNRSIFARLCMDLVEVSVDVSDERDGLKRVTERFLSWQKLFASMKNTLPISVLKGLIGEMLFADRVLAPQIGWKSAMESWLGPKGADRDFVYTDRWFEIKAISTGKNIVTISSLNQLETDLAGFLCLFNVDESSKTDSNAFSMSSLVKYYRNMLENTPEALRLFEQNLVSLGYIDKEEYEELFFVENGMSFYAVLSDFPRLHSNNVPLGIVGARYDLDIASINKWKVDESVLWK